MAQRLLGDAYVSLNASLELMLPVSVLSNRPFILTVEVRHAPPRESVTLLVEQRRGPKPFWPAQSTVGVADDAGVVTASFSVVLAGAGHAVFLVTAYDRAGTYYPPDGDVLQVF